MLKRRRDCNKERAAASFHASNSPSFANNYYGDGSVLNSSIMSSNQ